MTTFNLALLVEEFHLQPIEKHSFGIRFRGVFLSHECSLATYPEILFLGEKIS